MKKLTPYSLVLAIAVVVACTGERQRSLDGWTLGGDPVADADDTPSDAPIGGGGDGSDGSDAADILDVVDVVDATDTSDGGNPSGCWCLVDGAVCVVTNGPPVCLHERAECDDGACLEGFECFGTRCKCDSATHGDACIPRCDDDEDCGTEYRCSREGRCEALPRCRHENHALCPPNYWCDPGEDVCRPSEGKAVGASCEEDYECESGMCFSRSGECGRSCLSDADCPGEDKMCGYQTQKANYCAEYNTCSVYCPDHKNCHGDECHPALCRRTADCQKGDCLLHPGIRGVRDRIGQCSEEGESLCEGSEFRIAESDPFCRLPIDCQGIYRDVEDPCPEGYECVNDANFTGYRGTEWCSRRVTDGEWPRTGE